MRQQSWAYSVDVHVPVCPPSLFVSLPAVSSQGEPGMRVLHVAGFIVSRLCGNAGRTHKPFNPLLGETYEGYFPERGMRYLAESVSELGDRRSRV